MVRPACPYEVASIPSNIAASASIVVTANKAKYGEVSSIGYVPDAIVIAGAKRRQRILAAGMTKTWAYVQAGLDINADDEISCSELLDKVHGALSNQLYGSRMGMTAGIEQVHPFENYMVYAHNGDRFRQAYALDPVRRVVALSGGATRVIQKYADAESSIGAMATGRIADGEISACIERMARSQTGARYAYAPVIPHDNSVTYGALNSELVTQIIRNFANINKAADDYVAYGKRTTNTEPMKPSWSPVQLSYKNGAHKGATPSEFGNVLIARGIDIFSFALWAAQTQMPGKAKLVDGKHLSASAFAYVGDPYEQSTWKLPLAEKQHVVNALAQYEKAEGIPAIKKPEVLARIAKAARKFNVAMPKMSPGVSLTASADPLRRVPVDPLSILRRL
jgi:hypothetical protein